MDTRVNGKVKAIKDHVIVSEMNFAEEKTSGGIIVQSQDGKSAGVKPRWGKVFAVGPKQKDVQVGDWIFVEHGRWTRGFTYIDPDGNENTIRRVDLNGIMVVSDEKPDHFVLGQEYEDGSSMNIRPEDFM